jgi:hypothetical protein
MAIEEGSKVNSVWQPKLDPTKPIHARLASINGWIERVLEPSTFASTNLTQLQSYDKSRPSFGGWLATLLGMYLVGSGIFNIEKALEGGGTTTQQSSEILRQSGIDSSAVLVVIVLSYVVGAPIFLGSGLLTLGSIARHVKRRG